MRKVLIVLFLFLSTTTYAEIKIGGLFALTGPASILGQPEKQTAEMLVREINKNGGIKGQKIELIVYDTQSIDDEARKNLQDLCRKMELIL